MRLDESSVNWDLANELVSESYKLIAPEQLLVPKGRSTIRISCFALFLALILGGCGAQNAPPEARAHTSASAAQQRFPANWVRYTDPAEGAFSIDVPVGWQIQGGLYRYGYFDARWMMNVRSLDGAMIVRLSDASVPPYALPGPGTGQDRQPYARPKQFQMIVAGYRSAASYATLYARHRFQSVCKHLTSEDHAWQPTLPAAFKPDQNAQKVTYGGAAYRCVTSAGPRVALVYAVTVVYPSSYGSGLWVVNPLVSILTTPSDEPTATSVAQRMLNTWEKNPQWVAYQNKLTQVGLQAVMSNFQNFVQQMQAFDQARRSAMNAQVAGFESRMGAQAAQVSSFGDTLTGLQNATDPMTGDSFQVWTGPKSGYFKDASGNVINSNISPGAGFHQISAP